jgi:hypothetical protein
MQICNVNEVSLCEGIAAFGQDGKNGIVNISHDDVDVPLGRVQCKISKHLRVVDGVSALVTEVKSLAACSRAGKVVVDLIGHSTSKDRVFVFDGWVMRADSREDIWKLRSMFRAMSSVFSRIHAIRLIGCGTGVTDMGNKVLDVIQGVVGKDVGVYGTIADVNAESFTSSQYNSTNLRASGDSLSPAAFMIPDLAATPVMGEPLKRLLGRTPSRMIELDITQIWNVLGRGLEEGYATVSPGLLLEPLLSGEIPLTPSGGAQPGAGLQADVLYDWQFLRIWPPDGSEGVIFKIQDREFIQRTLLSLHTRPVGPAMRRMS